jgi:AICAR transformylase/IMP cyclohydrolase PurH
MSKIRRALLSVSDKTGVADLARALHELGVELLSTGGTAAQIRQAGLPVRDVSSYTGFPEIMDGRVKTLHPKVHGGLLGRRDVDASVMHEHGIEPIDLLVVNLYPFAATVARPGCSYDDAIENIDIGGPAMLRAAAKNHAHVAVLVDPGDYGPALEEIRDGGGLSFATRQRLAAKAYAHTASYDQAIAGYLEKEVSGAAAAETSYPQTLLLRFEKKLDLRYGCRARNCPSTTSPTPTRRSNACASSISPPASSSSTRTPAVWRWRRPAPRPTTGRTRPTRPRPSAGSSPSTGRWTPRRRQPSWSASSSRSSSRPRCRPTCWPCWPPSPTCVCS